ncbi:MAG: hypothetical protein KAI29_03720 [Cyclobacteriaceae bacterium]|nr:hypothetical protein [Cyclobacteriaceae bacterium]
MIQGQITAESTPDYDMPFNPFDSAWTVNDWILWHKALKAKYGMEEAQRRFIEAWEDQSIWSMPYSWWKYNRTFTDYFNSQGFDVGHTLSKTVTNVSKAIESTSQLTKLLLPLGVVVLGVYAYKQLV